MLQKAKSLVSRLGFVLGAVLPSGSARADITISNVDTVNIGLSQFTRGWEFSIDHTVTVTSLGWWDNGDDGLADSHQVAIWDMSGALFVSATVASGTTEPLINDFRFDATLTGNPALEPGKYVIAGLSTINDAYARNIGPGIYGNYTIAPGITFWQNQTNNSKEFSFPTSREDGIDDGPFGATFQFDNVLIQHQRHPYQNHPPCYSVALAA